MGKKVIMIIRLETEEPTLILWIWYHKSIKKGIKNSKKGDIFTNNATAYRKRKWNGKVLTLWKELAESIFSDFSQGLKRVGDLTQNNLNVLENITWTWQYKKKNLSTWHNNVDAHATGLASSPF